MTSNRTILITGVTGKQGGAVAQALHGAGFHLRGLTRKPDSERAAEILTEALGRPSGSTAKKWRQCWNGSIASGIARTSLAWNASSAARSRSSPIGEPPRGSKRARRHHMKARRRREYGRKNS
jgi:NmrA-like family